MGQGFQIEIRNATNLNIALNLGQALNVDAATSPPLLIASGGTTGLMYYEYSNQGQGNDDITTLVFNYAVAGQEVSGQTANITLHLDPDSTSEFSGSIYIAGFAPPALSNSPAVPATSPPLQYTVYPYLILNQTGEWPYGSLTLVQVVSPTMSVYTQPS